MLADHHNKMRIFVHPLVILHIFLAWLDLFNLFGRNEISGKNTNFFYDHDRPHTVNQLYLAALKFSIGDK